MRQCLQRLRVPSLGACSGRLKKEVLCIDEPSASLPEALRRFLLTESEDIHAMLANSCCEAREVAVGRHQAEAVEPAAMEQIHGVDHQGDIRRILPGRLCELLLGDDGMLG